MNANKDTPDYFNPGWMRRKPHAAHLAAHKREQIARLEPEGLFPLRAMRREQKGKR